jgi:DNA replicative helicase MCM subunit Mcm2 (Cdc46/Mcm family)
MCPQLRGLAAVKLATLLMLIGGLERAGEGGARIRGEIHMLLVGDPGTGASAPARPAPSSTPGGARPS